MQGPAQKGAGVVAPDVLESEKKETESLADEVLNIKKAPNSKKTDTKDTQVEKQDAKKSPDKEKSV